MRKTANKCAAASRGYAIEVVSQWFYNIVGFGGRAPQAKRRYAIEIVSHWFYNNIGFGGRALLDPPRYCYGGRAAPVAEVGR